jgi:hypothetical protein
LQPFDNPKFLAPNGYIIFLNAPVKKNVGVICVFFCVFLCFSAFGQDERDEQDKLPFDHSTRPLQARSWCGKA